MNKFKKAVIFFGMILYVCFGAIFFVHHFLPLKERLLLVGIFFILNLLLMIGFVFGKKGSAAAAGALLFVIMSAEAVSGYYVWSSIQALDAVSNKPSQNGDESREKPDVPQTQEELAKPFYVYLSGKDTNGSLEKTSRSDVNMILTVNPGTHVVHITTIPRDSYMRIAGKGNDRYDKLTHAGNYGVQTSEETLENFFGIKIKYHVMVNFDSIVDIVDALDGVEVENSEEFKAQGYRFNTGRIHLDGKQALVFARERYGLGDGELARGRNHVRIMKALIERATSPAILMNYPAILQVIAKEVSTNMPRQTMVDYINYQIANNKKWKISSSQLQCFGTMGLPSYQMPGSRLFMFLPSQESKRDILKLMQLVMDGKPLPSQTSKSYSIHEEDYADLPIYDIDDYLNGRGPSFGGPMDTPSEEPSYTTPNEENSTIENRQPSVESAAPENNNEPTTSPSTSEREPTISEVQNGNNSEKTESY